MSKLYGREGGGAGAGQARRRGSGAGERAVRAQQVVHPIMHKGLKGHRISAEGGGEHLAVGVDRLGLELLERGVLAPDLGRPFVSS